MTEPIPDLLVEKLALGELGAEQAAALRARLAAGGDARLEQIEASNAEIIASLAPREVAAEVARRVRREAAREARRAPSWNPWFAGAAVAAAAILVWLFVRTPASNDVVPGDAPKIAIADEVGPNDAIRLKGGAQLSIHRQTAGRPERLAAGATIAAGDTLQLAYTAGDATRGVIVSIDGAGETTLHFPESEDADSSLVGRAQLPNSYELDDAPGFERFFFVTTVAGALDPAGVLEAARVLARGPSARDGELVLRRGVEQISVLLVK